MGYWWVDRCLPGVAGGIVTSLLWAALLWVSHRKLGRRITDLTDQQTAHFDEKTDAQTRTLTSGEES